MDCFICNEPINDDFKAKLPCCSEYVHTLCLIPFAETHHNHNKLNVVCNCGSIIHRFNLNYFHHDPAYLTPEEIKIKMAERMNQPAFKKATQAIRVKIRNKNRLKREFLEFLRVKSRLYKESTITYSNTLKTMKNDAIKEIRDCEQYKNLRKATSSETRAINKFVADFGITDREAHIHLKGSTGRRRFWREAHYKWEILRRFRVRI